MTARILHKLTDHIGSVNTAIFDSSGNYTTNANNGRLVQTYEGHGWAVQGIAISNDSTQMVCCGGDRSVTMWDINTCEIKRRLTSGHKQRVDCVATNADASIVVSGSFDKTVAVWDTRSMQRTPLQVLDDAKDGISSVLLTSTEIISGSIDGSVRTYDMRVGKAVTDSLDQPVVSVRVSQTKDSQSLIVGCMDSTVQLVDRSSGMAFGTFSGHQCAKYRIQCDSNGELVASGSEDGFVYVWDVLANSETGSYISRLSGHSGIVNTVSFHPHSVTDSAKKQAMLSAASDGSVIIWG
ncbi:WD40-repeat-containing domain protein [Kickxella alabastrina]|uniref:WD40-repeat-containing domain protein n=1 Tax=Kickxella alabastrina TaxID=61397 RepID=UPI00221F5678|nr:WD40-repeat-containing domain protein [Kickxella alabastrina]KAI7833789.1 WD40-repeat-containing domain protein [Kickxella alabastrina]